MCKRIFVIVFVGCLFSIGLNTANADAVLDHSFISYNIDGSTPAYSGSPDDTGDDLANGIVASVSFSDADWVEWAPDVTGTPAFVIIVFDLGWSYDLVSVDISYMNKPIANVYSPENIRVNYSNDNVNFSPAQTITGFYEGAIENVFTTNFDLSGNTARYVKIKVNCDEYQANRWMFLSEFTFHSVSGSQPPCISVVPGDINCNDIVDNNDLKVLSLQWLQTPGDPSADIFPAGGDGAVDMLDLVFLANYWLWDEQAVFNNNLIKGKTVQIDTGFTYYQNRSNESLASELAVNGFEGVHDIVLDERYGISAGLIEECHKRGIGVYAMFFATCVYSPQALFPPGWEAWKMEFLQPQSFFHLSFAHPDYQQWYKERMVSVFGAYDYDGFVLAEPFYPIWDGPERNPIQYADVSAGFQQLFKDDTGNTAFPNFTNPADPHYFQTDIALYEDLVDYRAQTIVDFYNEIVNGTNGLRANFPDLVIASWSLAVDRPDAVNELREWEGHDAYLQVSTIQPDVHYFQTHWPDWIKTEAELPPDYAAVNYVPFFNEAYAADPNVPIAVQADIGSNDNMRKSSQWYRDFVAACDGAGIDSTTYYMFSLRSEIYFEEPVLKKATSTTSNQIKLHFDQMLDPACASVMVGRVLAESGGNNYTVQIATADGSIIILTIDLPVTVGETVSFPVNGIYDWPAVRFTSEGDQGPVNTIDAGTVVPLEVEAY